MTRQGSMEPNRVLDHEGFPGRWEILETADETDGERFKTRMELDEPGELPPHLHPTAEESYEVITGELEVQVKGEWSTVETGEKVVIPPDTEHAFRNAGPAEVINIHRPAMQFEEFFRGFHRLKTERGVPMPPNGLKSSILLAMLVVEHEDEQRIVSPPHWVFKILARVGHLLGYRLPTNRVR
ncbi:cupin domain-containing protein [Natrinema sp. 1APR25-10V2]|uniref:cupin domain-containing protein n=1 Tax=Natrinema sp. 1APR25-10V2 TaxID=2951081 RepID=UPI002874F370|nr:cupin domain-containing protein [Natrinema sp. 1APR25-10V2]MDS0474551.1 cupin domain-containing protein [Natrinema sp. 1APR25-10V2]